MRFLWDGGSQWGPADPPEAVMVWGPVDPPVSGPPQLWVAVRGHLVLDQLATAGWGRGRKGWFSTLQPSTASLVFRGTPDAEMGDGIVIHSEAGLLWKGTVDDIGDSETTDGQTETTVAATDLVGQLAQSFISAYSFAAMTTANRIYLLGQEAGLDTTVTLAPAVDPPASLPDETVTSSILDYLLRIERSVNGLLFTQPDGTFLLLIRSALPDADVTTYPLVGFDSPDTWRRRKSLSEVINGWTLVQPDGTGILDVQDAASVAAYGLRSYSVTDYMLDDAGPFSAGLRTAMAVPRWVLDSASFHVEDYSQAALGFKPLDWVDRDGDLWQLLEVRHAVAVSRDGRHDWNVTVAADQTQNMIVDVADPTPEEPEPPGTHTETVVYDGTDSGYKDMQLHKTDTGFESSDGGTGNNMAVGYWQGFRYRGLIYFPVAKPSGYIRVKKATLRLETSTQVQVAFGDDPEFYVRRIAGGSFSVGSTKWPGPASTTSGQVRRNIGRSESADIDIVVTDMVRDMVDVSNYGFRLQSVNEDSKTRTTEFRTEEGGQDPRLTVIFEVED